MSILYLAARDITCGLAFISSPLYLEKAGVRGEE